MITPIERKQLKEQAMRILKFQGMRKFCVLYLAPTKRECRSPWFLSRERVEKALAFYRRKYEAIIFVD